MKKLLLIVTVFISFQLFSENRVALIIGNSKYDSNPLKNPVNDAKDMSNTLEELGFDVILLQDSSKREMLSGIRDFGDRLNKNSVGLFYYAGHGVQVNSTNYLIPVNAEIIVESDVEFEGVPLDRLIRTMEDSKVNKSLVFLDACRDNPYASSSRSGTRGLTIVSADSGRDSAGALIAFATSPGSVAEDGNGENGTFTSAILKYIKEPGLEINQIMTKVRAEVMNQTNGKQKPWTNVSLTEEFYFSEESKKTLIASGGLQLSVYDPADVYIDGVFYDSVARDSQLTLMNIEGGDHILEFRYPNYIDKQYINVKSKDISSYQSVYESNPLFNFGATISGVDNVEVYINDEFIGKTPLNKQLPVNSYNVVFKHPSIESVERRINPTSREIVTLDITDFLFKTNELIVEGLPEGTTISISNEFGSSKYITDNGTSYRIPEKLISGEQNISFSHEYINDFSDVVNLTTATTITPTYTQYGDLKITSNHKNDIVVNIMNLDTFKQIDDNIPPGTNKNYKLPAGTYKVSYFRVEDNDPGIVKDLSITFNNSTVDSVENFDYSKDYKLNKLVLYRGELESTLAAKKSSRKKQQTLGWTLITSGLGSLAYGTYALIQKDSVYSDYLAAETSDSAAEYRDQLEQFTVTIPVTLIAGGVTAVAGLVRNLFLTDYSADEKELNSVDLDIKLLENNLER